MARIAGVNIPQNKVLHVALTYIHGIGKKFSNDICTELNIPKNIENLKISSIDNYHISDAIRIMYDKLNS